MAVTALDEAAPWHADGLDEAEMERAEHGPAALEGFVSEEAVDLPLQNCVQNRHPRCRQEQLPYTSEINIITIM